MTPARLAALMLVAACGSPQVPPGPRPAAPPRAGIPAPPPATTAEKPAPVSDAGGGAETERCGGLECSRHATAAEAFSIVLEDDPVVLAIGESHAQRGAAEVESATKRFTDQLLPLLAPRAADLVIEIWVADPACKKKTVKRVEKAQKQATGGQKKANQNEFLALGRAAKRLGMTPHVLVPSCAEYDAVVKAGPDAVVKMLEMIARLTAQKAKALLDASDGGESAQMVVAYGGGVHNDLEPRPGREAWSFGPALDAQTAGRYVEVDLIVPEFIRDDEVWRALPWFEHFDPGAHPEKATLIEVRPRSWVLVFPRAGRPRD